GGVTRCQRLRVPATGHACARPRRTSLLVLSRWPPSSLPLYPLSLHDALPILVRGRHHAAHQQEPVDLPLEALVGHGNARLRQARDRKSTRLNSSHRTISYAVFCLKKNISPPSPSPIARPPRQSRPPHRGYRQG